MHCRLLALIFCLPLCVHAQERSISLQPTWRTGEQVQYEITSSRSSEREGTTPSVGTSRSVAHVRVQDSGADGATHVWRFETPTTPGQPLASGAAEKLTHILQSFSMQLQLDGDASIVGIVNAADVRNALQSTVEALFEARPETPEALAQREQFQRVLGSLFSDERRLLHLVTKEAQLLYSPIGGEYKFSSSRRLRGSTVTPFSSEAISTDNEIVVSPLNEATGTYTITFAEVPDPEGVARIADEFLRQMSSASAAEMPSRKGASLQLHRVAAFEMSLDSSWPLAVRWTQTIAAGTARRLESIELTRRSLVHQQ